MTHRIFASAALGSRLSGVVLAVTVGVAVAHSTSVTPLPAAACSAVQNPSGDLLIASDLPLDGPGRSEAVQMAKAIAFALGQAGWKAGKFTLAYQSCDDSTAQTGQWDSGTCSTNASAYAADLSLVGVIGTLNSGCAEIEMPIANRAPNGPLAMVSPANTYVGLTHTGPGTAPGEPGVYYPTGRRSYARVVAANDVQGAADATLAYELHVTRLFVLNDKQAYGAGVATSTANAARKLGITVVKNETWDPRKTSYAPLALQIKASDAQAVFLGGLISDNGGTLIKDIRNGAPQVTILAPDGFTPISADLQQSSETANGMYISVAGLPISTLPATGQAFFKTFSNAIGAATIAPSSVDAAQAADVMLKAISNSDGTGRHRRRAVQGHH
ncbi:MAG: branched-chain amino acid ABC transporter substrate-binding protein, partial [Actinomycetota bacterium]|nr:branched-chain amino acid ABC transporter substrate-binding protein [Actinomycetota bacterium]